MLRGSLHLIIISLLVGSVSTAQNDNWKTFFCGRDINSIAAKGKDLYAGTNFGLVHINLETNETSFYNKSNTSFGLHNSNHLYVKRNGDVIFSANYGGGICAYHPATSIVDYGGDIDMTCAAEDKDGNLYVGGMGFGVQYSRYDIHWGRNVWYQWIQSNSPLPSNNVEGLHFDKNQNLWILLSDSGLVKYDGANWTIYSKPDSIEDLTTMAFDKDENIWIGTQRGLVKFSNGTWTKYNPPVKMYLEHAVPWVTSVAVDSLNNVWVGSMFTGLYKFDGTNWTRYLAENTNLESSYVNSVYVDYKNRIWVGTYIGLYRLEGDSFIEYNTSNCSIPNIQVRLAMPDSKGNIWILNENYGSPSSSPKNTAAITKYDGKNFTVYKAIDVANTHYNFFSMTVDQNDNVWAITNNGLYKFDGVTWTQFRNDLNNYSFPYDICADIYGNIWTVTSDNDIIKFNRKDFQLFENKNLFFPSGEVKVIKSAGNYVYIGFENDSKVYKIDIPKSKERLNVSTISTPANNIQDICVNFKNKIWVAGDSTGVFKYDGNGWTNYTYQNSGLPNNAVISIDADKNGNVLAACEFSYSSSPYYGGIAYFNGSEWKTFRYEDSPLSLSSIYTAKLDNNGNAWIAGYGGVCVYNPNKIQIDTVKIIESNVLYQSYPNPTNDYALIKYSLSKASDTRLVIYDMLGREVVTLVNNYQAAGNYAAVWTGKNKEGNIVCSGMFVYSLITNEAVQSKKLIWLK